MGRLKIFGTIEENFKIFSDGNPGAIKVLFELMKQAEDKIGLLLITLDKMQLYGSHIYMLWNDCCDRNINKVIKILELYELEIITQKDIDERIKNVGFGLNFDEFLEEEFDNGNQNV